MSMQHSLRKDFPPYFTLWFYLPLSFLFNHLKDAKIFHFVQEASRKGLESGSTATIVLLVEGQILVANVGDSKAVICSERHHRPCEYKGLFVNNMSMDTVFFPLMQSMKY